MDAKFRKNFSDYSFIGLKSRRLVCPKNLIMLCYPAIYTLYRKFTR